jgi:hypothetical protein
MESSPAAARAGERCKQKLELRAKIPEAARRCQREGTHIAAAFADWPKKTRAPLGALVSWSAARFAQ